MRLLAAALSLGLAAGCAYRHPYELKPELAANAGNFEASGSSDTAHNLYVAVGSIDGVLVDSMGPRYFKTGIPKPEVKVAGGDRKLRVLAVLQKRQFMKSALKNAILGGDPAVLAAVAPLDVRVEAGKVYVASGAVRGDSFAFWLAEKETGAKLTSEAVAPFRDMNERSPEEKRADFFTQLLIGAALK